MPGPCRMGCEAASDLRLLTPFVMVWSALRGSLALLCGSNRFLSKQFLMLILYSMIGRSIQRRRSQEPTSSHLKHRMQIDSARWWALFRHACILHTYIHTYRATEAWCRLRLPRLPSQGTDPSLRTAEFVFLDVRIEMYRVS